MSKHIELATPCPNCQSRLTLSVRRTPLIRFHAVRLACENGCDLHWYYYDLPNRRARFPTVEQCADYHDGVIRREGEENERILAFECPNCGECPHVSSKSIGRQTFPTVTCRCASYWDRDLHSALCGWLAETKTGRTRTSSKKSAVPRRFGWNPTARSAAGRCLSASSRPAMTDAGVLPYTMPAHAISNHCYRGYAHATKRRRWRMTSTSTGARPWPPSRTLPTVHTAVGRPNAHGTIRPTYGQSAAENATNRTTAYPTTS